MNREEEELRKLLLEFFLLEEDMYPERISDEQHQNLVGTFICKLFFMIIGFLFKCL